MNQAIWLKTVKFKLRNPKQRHNTQQHFQTDNILLCTQLGVVHISIRIFSATPTIPFTAIGRTGDPNAEKKPEWNYYARHSAQWD